MTVTATMETLTARQRDVLAFIRASVDGRGYPPSMREIGDAVGLSSTSSVVHQLRALERKGYLHRDPIRRRAITITDTAYVADPRIDRYREALEELAKGGCISGHQHPHCWDCYKQVRDWCHPCVAQFALDPWIDREATA